MKKYFACVAVIGWLAIPPICNGTVPFITAQPASQTVLTGTTATFSVAATSASSLSYQWNFNSTIIPDATNSTLMLTNVQPDQAGNYAVTVSSDDGATNSSFATLTVYLAPTSIFFDDFSGPTLNPMWTTNLPDAYSASYPNGYTTPEQYVGAPNFSFQTLAGSSVIHLSNTLGQLQRCGWGSASNFVTSDFRYDARFNTLIQSSTTSIDGFIEIWIINATNSSLYDIVSPFGGGYDTKPYKFFVGSTIDGTFTQTPFTYDNNTWYHLVLAGAPGQNLRASICADDGTELVGSTLAHGAEVYGSGFQIALSQEIGGSGAPYPVDVAVDYVSLTSGSAPVITTQPTNQTVATGGTASFNVSASGTAPLAYQWSFNGAAISAATNSMFILTNIQANQSGAYSVEVVNAYGAAYSSNATLIAGAAPTINTQPSPQTVAVGGTVTFNVDASGALPLTYQWAFNGANLAFATNDFLQLTNVQFSQAGSYSVSIANPFGTLLSSNAALVVQSPPFMTSQPAGVSVLVGATVTFTASAGGSPPLAYLWNFNGTNISGATNTTLILTNVQMSQAGGYVLTVSNAFGGIRSSNAVLTLESPLASSFFDDFGGTNLNPIWQTNLPNNAYCGSFQYGYSQTATYLGAPHFGFQTLNGDSVLRLTNSLAPLQRRGWGSSTNFGGTNFYYEARFNTLIQSSTTSIDGFFEIWIINATNSSLYDIVSPFGGGYDSKPYKFFVGSTIDDSFTQTAFTYDNNTWYHLVLQCAPGANIRASILSDAGTELIGQTFSHSGSAYPSGFKIGISQVVGASGGTYPVDVAVDYVSLNTTYPPLITAQPTNQAAAVGGTASFSVSATGLAPLNYQWSFNGTNITGATNATLTLTNIQLPSAGNYSVAVTNSAGATNSVAADLTVVAPLAITQQPQSQTVLSFSSASFSVAATGTGPLSYQWQKNGTNLLDGGNVSGSATTSLNLASVSVSDAGNYDVVVSNPYATTNSAVAILTVPQTVFTLGTTNAMSGSTIAVPIWMNALGIENAFLASVGYDPTKLVLQAVIGFDLAPVYTQTNNGYVGFAVVLDPGATFSAGSNQVADLIFTTLPVTNLTTVNLVFGDFPTGRQVVDNNFDALPAAYLAGSVVLSPAEYAADVYPRTNGDSQVNIFDWLEMGRMVAGLDVPTNSDEFMRADCAPRNAPDGVLTVADWVQAGRYALGLDPLTLVTPPATPSAAAKVKPHDATPTRILQIANVSAQRGQTVIVPVQLVCTNNENAVGMTIRYNTNQLSLLSVAAGSALTGGRLNINSNRLAGQVGLALALSPGTAFAAGTNQLAQLQFLTSTNASGSAAVTLQDTLVKLEVADLLANSLATAYVNGSVALPAQPAMVVTGKGGNLQLSWPFGSGTFQVDAATSPLGPWATIALPILTNGANATVIVSPTNQQQYFRLQGQ